MMRGTGDLLSEAFVGIEHLTRPVKFNNQAYLLEILLRQTVDLIGASQLLTATFFQGSKANEIVGSYPHLDLSANHQIQQIKEPYREPYLSSNEVKELERLTWIFPAKHGRTNRMGMKSGNLDQGTLSFKSIPLKSRRQYQDIFPKAMGKDRIILQPLTTIARPITLDAYGNSHSPLNGIIYQSTLHTIKKDAWNKPGLLRDSSFRLVLSESSAAMLKIRSNEMKFNQILAHLLLAEAITNPLDGSAFSNND
ncbi:MAG: hypothetical protein WAV40_01625 [Microgenomates group bacterium]